MTLLGLTLTQLATLFAAIGGAVTLLYVLKLRRRRVAVPFAKLWERVIEKRQSDSLFRRLKRLLSLLLQLAFLFLLVAALGNPRLSTTLISERRIILLIDASASMKTSDVQGQSRLDAARAKARKIISGLSASDAMMLVRLDAQVTPLTPFTGDPKPLLSALDKLQATDTRADLARALKFCADALHGRKKPMVILIGDGAYDKQTLAAVTLDARSGKIAPNATSKPTSKPASKSTTSRPTAATKSAASKPASKHGLGQEDLNRISLEGIAVRFIGVGTRDDNVGIVAFNARRYPTNKLSFEIFLEIVNYRKAQTEVDLQLISDGVLNDTKRLVLAPGQRARYTCSPEDRKTGKKSWCDMAASGELLEARLVKAGSSDVNTRGRLDPFPLDDRAYALLPRRHKMKVLLVSRGNLFLEGALLLDESITLERVKPANYTKAKLRGQDAAVFDSWIPEDWVDEKSAPRLPTLLVNPPAGHGPFVVKGRIDRPFITEQNETHPVMRFITLKDVNISHAVKFERRRGDVVLAASLRDPILVARDDGKAKRVAFGFDPKRSDLPLRVAFPLLVINTINWFSGESEGLITTYRAGDTWHIPLGPPATGTHRPPLVDVVPPSGPHLKAPVTGAYAVLHGRHVGIYTIHDGTNTLRIAANLANPDESKIAPRTHLVLGGRTLKPPEGFSVKLRREIWIYLLLIGLLLIILEWVTYNRRLTV
ncbi:MAG: VWA domain-containing protein [Deltaproteobacteria bacterium]|nr:VWA domain-containing protein [Deltaproteobacteria bacterium]